MFITVVLTVTLVIICEQATLGFHQNFLKSFLINTYNNEIVKSNLYFRFELFKLFIDI